MNVHYDEQFDVLEIFFQAPQPAITVEIEEDRYAHILPETKQLIGITIHHFRELHPQVAFPFLGVLSPVGLDIAKTIERALSAD